MSFSSTDSEMGEGTLLPVCLRVRYNLADPSGTCLAVLGSDDSLGSWQPSSAVRATSSNGADWEVKVSVPMATPVQWKWAVLDKVTGSVLRWETRDNRQLYTETSGLTLTMDWDGDLDSSQSVTKAANSDTDADTDSSGDSTSESAEDKSSSSVDPEDSELSDSAGNTADRMDTLTDDIPTQAEQPGSYSLTSDRLDQSMLGNHCEQPPDNVVQDRPDLEQYSVVTSDKSETAKQREIKHEERRKRAETDPGNRYDVHVHEVSPDQSEAATSGRVDVSQGRPISSEDTTMEPLPQLHVQNLPEETTVPTQPLQDLRNLEELELAEHTTEPSPASLSQSLTLAATESHPPSQVLTQEMTEPSLLSGTIAEEVLNQSPTLQNFPEKPMFQSTNLPEQLLSSQGFAENVTETPQPANGPTPEFEEHSQSSNGVIQELDETSNPSEGLSQELGEPSMYPQNLVVERMELSFPVHSIAEEMAEATPSSQSFTVTENATEPSTITPESQTMTERAEASTDFRLSGDTDSTQSQSAKVSEAETRPQRFAWDSIEPTSTVVDKSDLHSTSGFVSETKLRPHSSADINRESTSRVVSETKPRPHSVAVVNTDYSSTVVSGTNIRPHEVAEGSRDSTSTVVDKSDIDTTGAVVPETKRRQDSVAEMNRESTSTVVSATEVCPQSVAVVNQESTSTVMSETEVDAHSVAENSRESTSTLVMNGLDDVTTDSTLSQEGTVHEDTEIVQLAQKIVKEVIDSAVRSKTLAETNATEDLIVKEADRAEKCRPEGSFQTLKRTFLLVGIPLGLAVGAAGAFLIYKRR